MNKNKKQCLIDCITYERISLKVKTKIREQGGNIWVARLILDRANNFFCPQKAALIVSNIVSCWPNIYPVHTFLTFGGFIEIQWPSGITEHQIGNPINPASSALNSILNYVDNIITNNFLSLLKSKNLSHFFKYLTVGIDLFDPISNFKIELVYLIETSKMEIVNRTGKSYPLYHQQNELIRITNLNSHFYNRNMILGCHDLKIFDNRSLALSTGWKAQTIKQMRSLFQNANTALVLHHPHFIDTYRTFWNAIVNLTRLKTDVSFVSSFRYYNIVNSNQNCRQPLDRVLENTIININCIDFIMT